VCIEARIKALAARHCRRQEEFTTMTVLYDTTELSRVLRVPASKIEEMARQARLPFAFSPGRGLFVAEHDLAQWRSAIARDDCCGE
jgi:Helix-turn-helix domain